MINVTPNGTSVPDLDVYPSANGVPSTVVNLNPHFGNSGDNRAVTPVAPKALANEARSVSAANSDTRRTKLSKDTSTKPSKELDDLLTDFRLVTAEQTLDAERIWLEGGLAAERLKEQTAAALRIKQEAIRQEILRHKQENDRKVAAELSEVAAHNGR